MPPPPSFLFVTCQVGAERAVKTELARDWPELRFAYSRPGFLTFKLPAEHDLPDDFNLGSVFARSYGFSLGKTQAASIEQRVAEMARLAPQRRYDKLHVFQRDTAAPGDHGFEPQITPWAEEAEACIRRLWPTTAPPLGPTPPAAKAGQLVLDCVLVEPDQWWIGYHQASGWTSRRPGGLSRLQLPEDAVSRAYLKMEQALRWSRLPIQGADQAAELGCSPGGSSQVLLRHGLKVIGIDPAVVHPALVGDRNFRHIRKRAGDVRRSELRDVRWLFADMNVAPQYTLDAVEAIATSRRVQLRGLLVTLKLLDWDLADEVPDYLARIRSWGFPYVRARQLQFNRQEICVVALRRRPNPKSKEPRRT
ncbi:MAG TPA: SAM-dependent methyltransferase [Pirellulales bacterium]|jgi:23S rRNA (cytidine2498-2'-O)-methyltransferase|nr:SAM-dependent methyltransferase [Pirellulales bacterium]